MNTIGAYEGLDMEGLVPEWYEFTVPVEAQKRLITAIPEVRILWNQKIKKFQLVYRTPGKVTRYWDNRFMRHWGLLAGDFDPPLDAEAVIGYLRRCEAFNREIAEMGFPDLDAYIDSLIEKKARATTAARDAMFDAFFGSEGSLVHHGSLVSRPYRPPLVVARPKPKVPEGGVV